MFDRVYNMSRIATLKTFIDKRKNPMCGHFMVKIGVSVFTTTINHFDTVVLRGEKNQNNQEFNLIHLKDIEGGLTSLLKT